MKSDQNFGKLLAFSAAVTFFVLFMLEKYSEKISLQTKSIACGRFPTEHDITVDNTIWQVLETSKGFVKLMNAYWDDRQNQIVVRINANSIQLDIKTDSIYCQFWFDEETHPYIVRASEYLLMWNWDVLPQHQLPYLIECPYLNFQQKIPSSVSLTCNPCDHAENNLKIINNQPADGVKKKFGVCSKSITFTDRSFGIRFIEWVHLLKLLGAEKIIFFYEFLHPEIFEVVKYFEDQGIVEALPYFDPSGILDSTRDSWQNILLQMNTLNDCFYRMKSLFDFVVIFDPDEVIMPVMEEDLTWHDIFSKLNYSKRDAGFCSQNVYYPEVGQPKIETVPEKMYMLQHIQRSKNFTDRDKFVKSFHDTKLVKVVHNHSPLFCFSYNNKCHRYKISPNISQVSHYRSVLRSHEASFNVTVEDKTIWKFMDRLIEAVQETLKATGFKP